MNVLYLSICIPTSGVSKWVLPVLESIYCQAVPKENFEVVVVDNGNGDDLNSNKLYKFMNFSNFKYFKSKEQGFLNQIFAFKQCKGKLIKFVNHRFLLADGSINYLINFSKKRESVKPSVYFSNSFDKSLKFNKSNDFFNALGIISSWSGGVAFWKDEKPREANDVNKFFPHFCLLEKPNSTFIIDNKKIFEKEIDNSATNKGRYNVFYAFSVEYINLNVILLYKDQISFKTFNRIKKQTFKFIANLYLDYVFLKRDCSYDLNHYREFINVNFSFSKVRFYSFLLLVWRVLKGKV